MGVCRASRLLCVIALLEVTSGVPAYGQDSMTLRQEAIAAQEQGHHGRAAGLFLQLFDRSMADPDLLYAAGRSFAQAGMTQEAFQALHRAMESGFVVKQALELDDQLDPLRADSLWEGLWDRALQQDERIDHELRQELLTLAERDQETRRGLMELVQAGGIDSATIDSLVRVVGERDAPIQERVRAIIDEHGWPGRRLVGDDGASAAWLVVQHMDDVYQADLLPLLREASERGDARLGHLAYLEDRVRVNAGLPQLYGTQFKSTIDGRRELYPIEDEARVDERRARMGMGPLADYLAFAGVKR